MRMIALLNPVTKRVSIIEDVVEEVLKCHNTSFTMKF